MMVMIMLLLSYLQCNNPMTKEAKLTAAQRIISEWTEYDTEIKNVMQGFKESKASNTQGEWTAEEPGRGGLNQMRILFFF